MLTKEQTDLAYAAIDKVYAESVQAAADKYAEAHILAAGMRESAYRYIASQTGENDTGSIPDPDLTK